MTYSDLQHWSSEVIVLVNKTLDAVKEKSFSNYVLLLARGGYQVEMEHTFLSPYVVSSRLEIYQDKTREQFLVDYLNMYESLLKDSVFMTDNYKEYDLNLQLMIYAQIWESHQFLKTLKRIGGILTGKPYDWRIPFEYVNRNGDRKMYPKSKMMQDDIIPTLREGAPELAKFIENYYDSELRNDFAHASYYISIEENAIMSWESERYVIKKKTDLFEWEEIFINSVLLSYSILHIIRERRNSFIDDFPEIESIVIDWPSFKEPGTILKTAIIPEKTDWGVEFNFYRK